MEVHAYVHRRAGDVHTDTGTYVRHTHTPMFVENILFVRKHAVAQEEGNRIRAEKMKREWKDESVRQKRKCKVLRGDTLGLVSFEILVP